MAKLILFSTRITAAATTVASDVTELRTSGYTTAGDGGGATYLKVGASPSHAGKIQTADGAWWEMAFLDGKVSVKQFGAVGDATTDDRQAFLDAQAFLGAKAVLGPTAWAGTGEIHVPVGQFRLSDRFDIKAAGPVALVGHSGGVGDWPGSQLRFDANKAGIVVQQINTTGNTTDATLTGSGTGARIENLMIYSAGGTGPYDGIWCRTRCLIRDCFVRGFPRDGVRIEAASGSGGATEGNANCFRIEGLLTYWNKGNGLFVNLADANAGYCIGVDASHNGRWGIWDSSFLGNTYLACHSATNGIRGPNETPNTDNEGSMVSYGGNWYSVAFGQEVAASTTVPGTNSAVWIYSGPGGVYPDAGYPAWASGSTYVVGGAYCSDDPNAANVFLGCYSEGGQSPSQIANPAVVLSGLHAAGIVGPNTLSQKAFAAADVNSAGVRQTVTLGGDANVGEALKFNLTGVFEDARLHFKYGDILWDRFNSDGFVTFIITGPSTGFTFGRSAIQPDAFWPLKLFVGSVTANARCLDYGTAAPTTGAHGTGDIVFNTTPTAGGKAGWICITAGTPGTWKPFGAIDA